MRGLRPNMLRYNNATAKRWAAEHNAPTTPLVTADSSSAATPGADSKDSAQDSTSPAEAKAAATSVLNQVDKDCYPGSIEAKILAGNKVGKHVKLKRDLKHTGHQHFLCPHYVLSAI